MKIFGTFICILFLFTSCEKEDIETFQAGSGLYFTNQFSSYNFMENYENKLLGSDTLNIAVSVTGNASSLKREFLLEVVKDSLYTAEEEMFTLLPGTIEANEFNGIVPVIIHYSTKLDDSVYVARIKIKGNDNFPELNQFDQVYSINFSNKITIPENWSVLKSRFGNYSNSWYSYILSVTKLAYIPYWTSPTNAKNPDPKKYWMTFSNLSPYISQVKVALTDYNNAHPDKPMLHEDGEFKGKPVVMP